MKELEFRGRLGDGAEADVWRAWDPELERHVAVKVFRPSCADNAHVLAQARALARVESRHVVKVYEFAEVEPPEPAGRHPAVLMEAFPGEKLGRRLTGVMFSRSQVRAVGMGLLEGLASIHAVGIAHGDLHDGNILVADNGDVRIIDILYRGSLAAMSTASREEKVRKDARSLLAMLAEVLFHSDLDPEAGQRLRRLSRDSLDLDVLHGAFEEALAAFEPALSLGKVLTAPTPDVRVTTGAGATDGPPQPGLHFLAVTVANHSPVRVYVQSLLLPLPENRLLAPQVDAVYRRPISAPVIEPGDSWQVPLDAEAIAQAVGGDIDLVMSVVITDKIGREYLANGDEVRAKLREVLSRINASKASPPSPPEKPDAIQQAVLDLVASEHLQSCAQVSGITIRMGLGSVKRPEADVAIDALIPRWLTRGNPRPADDYRPTLSGLLLSAAGGRVADFVERVLRHWKTAVPADPKGAKISSSQVEFAGFDLPFMSAVLSLARLGGGGTGGKDHPFEFGIPFRIDDILECDTAADVAALWLEPG